MKMGTYYIVACDRCKTYYSPTLMKMPEMQGNLKVAAEIGRFTLEHSHGLPTVRLVPDEYAERTWDSLDGYTKQTVLDDGH
jgi:hypothetical protein